MQISFAYMNIIFYLCARNCKMGNCVTTGDKIIAPLARQFSASVTQSTDEQKPWQI